MTLRLPYNLILNMSILLYPIMRTIKSEEKVIELAKQIADEEYPGTYITIEPRRGVREPAPEIIR